MKGSKKHTLLLFLFSCFALLAQEKKAGPVIQDYGKVWSVDSPSYPINKDGNFKVVFDIMYSPDDPTILNTSIETAARFLNMHAQAGVPSKNMEVALVVHSKASKDLCTNEAYQKRFGVNNPNADMIAQLIAADVQFVFCGQSSSSRNLTMEETIEGVQLSLSAMTALIQLQNEGFRLIKF